MLTKLATTVEMSSELEIVSDIVIRLITVRAQEATTVSRVVFVAHGYDRPSWQDALCTPKSARAP